MCPLLCTECRSPIQLPDRCSHATCFACGLILEDLPVINGDEALIDRSNAPSHYRTRVSSGTLGRWQRLRFLQQQMNREVYRHAQLQAYFRGLKASLGIPILRIPF